MDYLLFCVLLCSSIFFSGSETAFFKLTSLQLAEFSASGSRLRQRINALRSAPRDLLITVLLGNELTNIAISIVGAGIISRLMASFGVELSLIQQAVLSSSLIVPLLLIVGEITPKTIASFSPVAFSSVTVYPLSVFSWCVSPIKHALHWASDLIVKRLIGEEEPEGGLDERGFKALVEAGAREGEVEHEERELIFNAFHFGDLSVRDVMTPWAEVVQVQEHQGTADAIELVVEREVSRLPVLRRGSVAGVLYTKKLLELRWSEAPLPPLESLIDEALFTTPLTNLNTLMDRFKRDSKHFSIVINARGIPVGVCTLDDLLEVLFGPIEEGETTDD